MYMERQSILIIDDNNDNLKLAAKILKEDNLNM